MDGTNLTWIGIDVAKATLDLHFLPSGQAHSPANNPTGHRQLRQLLPATDACRIVLEATGGYERLLVADLAADGTAVERARLMRIVRLGEGVDRTGAFSADALRRTFIALDEYAEVLDLEAVEQVRFVATSASRDVSNREAFAVSAAACWEAASGRSSATRSRSTSWPMARIRRNGSRS